MRYAVVIKTSGNYSAYVLDLPGCVATGGRGCRGRRTKSRADAISMAAAVVPYFLFKWKKWL
jgi:predicted RNase H-like HicB family nuclease